MRARRGGGGGGACGVVTPGLLVSFSCTYLLWCVFCLVVVLVFCFVLLCVFVFRFCVFTVWRKGTRVLPGRQSYSHLA